MTHMLDARNLDHKAILLHQKCFRFGLGNSMFLEQLFHRYFDFKYKAKNYHWTPDQLQNDVIGTALYLEYLQRAGLIRIVCDSLESDPSLQGAPVHLIQCVVVRGYKLIKQYRAEQKVTGDVSGLMVRQGTHILGLASILEAGGPKG